MAMCRGIVVATHPGDHSVDLVLADGRRLTGVQVLTPNGSARTGVFDMPAMPKREGEAKWDITKPHGQDQHAIVDWVDGIPIVVGFLYPQISQMTFEDEKLRFERHQSDVSWSVDGGGNIQINHPSGTYIRIGEQPDAVPISHTNTDQSLDVDRNTEKRVHLRIGFADQTLTLTMTPQGEVLLECDRNVNFKTDGDIRFQSGGSIKFTAPSGMTFDTPNGHFSNIATANVDFIANNVSLVSHPHPNLVLGTDDSDRPRKTMDSSGPEWDGIAFPTA